MDILPLFAFAFIGIIYLSLHLVHLSKNPKIGHNPVVPGVWLAGNAENPYLVDKDGNKTPIVKKYPL